MVMIVNLDNMLKLASTENALKIDLNYNHEMKVGGLASFINGLLLGSPAYGQTKFNVPTVSSILILGQGALF